MLQISVPQIRVTAKNDAGINGSGKYVLYWMTANRRTRFNFALQHAVSLANSLAKPLLVFEPLAIGYRWASERFHGFVRAGMLDNAEAIASSRASYCGYIEPTSGHSQGLIEGLAKEACVVVTDDYPCFFYPQMYALVSRRISCRLDLVDSSTLFPMRSPNRTFTVAHSFRRYLQKEFAECFPAVPCEEPLKHLNSPKLDALPASIAQRYGLTLDEQSGHLLRCIELSSLSVDHSVKYEIDGGSELVRHPIGGAIAAGKVLKQFISHRLLGYDSDRNDPSSLATSGLSPYLHFGNLSSFEVFQEIALACNWSVEQMGAPNGKVNGFWNMGASAEAYLDQLLTWREIGFNMCVREKNYDRYESLPVWALQTLREHELDDRNELYSLEQLENAETGDKLWNAGQRQLVRDGTMHNYLRMLWGKKILQWSPTPRMALERMIQLNNKYAFDGRDPNSYSGIFWVLGRYDRAWGPERPIFGKIRYMTSESALKKFSWTGYLQRYDAR